MHTLLEFAHGVFGAKEMRKDGAVPTEGLGPAMTAFANRIFKVSPHRVQCIIRIADVAAKRVRAIGPQEFLGFGSIDVCFAVLLQKSECNTGVQQAWEFLRIRRPVPIEDPKLDRGEHGLRTAKRVDQIKNVVGGGHSRLAPASCRYSVVRRVFLLLWYRSGFLGRDASDAPYIAVRNLLHREALVPWLRL